MQSNQICPRCGTYNRVPETVSLRLTTNPLGQLLASSQITLTLVTIGCVLALFNTFLGGLAILFGAGPGFLFLFDDFSSLLIFGLTIAGDVIFFTVLLDYFRAKSASGRQTRCQRCGLLYNIVPVQPALTFKQIVYRQFPATTTHLVEGVQCPNPACGSLAIKCVPYLASLTRNPIFGLFRNRYSRIVVNAIVFIGVFVGTLQFLTDSSLLDFLPFNLLWIWVILTAVFLSQYILSGLLGRRLVGRNYTCAACKFSWTHLQTPAELVPFLIKWYEQENRLARKRGKPAEEAVSLLLLAHYKFQYKQISLQEAITMYEGVIRLLQQAEDKPENKRMLAGAFNSIGYNLIKTGNYQLSISWIERGLALYRELQAWDDYKNGTHSLGEALLRAGRVEEAVPVLKESVFVSRQSEGYWPNTLFWGLQGLAEAGLRQGQPVITLRLCAAIETQRNRLEVKLSPVEQDEYDALVKAARQQTDSATYLTAWHEGTQMNLEQTINYAYDLTTVPLG